jgi:transcriptional regulator with XRE-family HTH domain
MGGQEIKNTLGKNIKVLRFRRQYSQADLAEKANISITFLSNIERGIKFPKPDILSKIAGGLEAEVYELFMTDLVPKSQKKTMNNFSEDLKGTVISALDGIFKQYLG